MYFHWMKSSQKFPSSTPLPSAICLRLDTGVGPHR
jgi:hypothetical protein